ncbi:glycosyltransferase family 4 protein [Streptomyces stelliscabiei]|uniref:glycosyltransferase family 4 protein n=1 Tax=Streptomyces stelliscabiei TaxID=146820 RepID=UPI0029AB4956|nr:glycosyltransferase family 4 protein [Streptomyces stelliscabiei]MDX2550100.1 glycosyltransferase family 4 protein [Streptomyces stelliscabiei]
MGRFHFWAADTAGSSYYRSTLPGISLQWLGHQVSGGMRLPHDWRDLDALVGCRVAKPEPTQMWQHFKQETNTRLVLDLDDDYFHIDPTNQHAAATWGRPMLQRLADNMALADLVTCCSEPLARVLRDYAADVRVIPNGLPAQLLGKPRDYRADGRPLSVGWAGTSSTVAELPEAVRALNRIATYPRPGGVQVRIVGITAEHAMGLGLKGRGIGALGWVPSVDSYLQAVAEWDVWVAPYRDTAFNRAKFPTKWLESSVLGIPLIASDIEPYRTVIRHGENGFLVRHEHEWGRYLKQLVDDPELRQRVGMAARGEASGSIMQALHVQWQAALTAPVEVAA